MVLILGICGIVLIFLSGWFDSGGKSSPSAQKVAETVSLSAEAYTASLETRMTRVLESITGVGEAKVMITLESGTEYVYAQEIKSDTTYSDQEGRREEHSQRENSYLVLDGDEGKEALVLQEIQPRIKGVVVVCQGGKDSDVRQSVTQAVTVALNITSSRIYVAALS